jgi:hypothetical protein
MSEGEASGAGADEGIRAEGGVYTVIYITLIGRRSGAFSSTKSESKTAASALES